VNTKQAVEFLRLVADRLAFYESVKDIDQELERLRANKDVLHRNIKREAEKEAAEQSKAMLDDARKRAKQSAEDAQQEAAKVIREAQVKALQIVSEAETRARGLEDHVVVEKARALLAKSAA
jgi:vacuolar-type H+-ATPase subunit H